MSEAIFGPIKLIKTSFSSITSKQQEQMTLKFREGLRITKVSICKSVDLGSRLKNI